MPKLSARYKQEMGVEVSRKQLVRPVSRASTESMQETGSIPSHPLEREVQERLVAQETGAASFAYVCRRRLVAQGMGGTVGMRLVTQEMGPTLRWFQDVDGSHKRWETATQVQRNTEYLRWRKHAENRR